MSPEFIKTAPRDMHRFGFDGMESPKQVALLFSMETNTKVFCAIAERAQSIVGQPKLLLSRNRAYTRNFAKMTNLSCWGNENYSPVAKLSVRNQKPALQKRPPQ